MQFLKRVIGKEPIGALALLISTMFLVGQSGYIYNKFRTKLVVSIYHSDTAYLSKCRLSQLRIDNKTSDIVEDIRIIIAQDYLARRDALDEMKILYRSDAMFGKGEFIFAERVELKVPFSVEGNVMVVPHLNPGEWLDLVMVFYGEDEEQIERIEAAEKIRDKFDKSSNEYFTPRIVNVSSDDGKAMILHHKATCLSETYRPSSDSWRFWHRTTG